MAKNILLIAGQSKEEQDLLRVLKEINFGVFIEAEVEKIKRMLETHPVRLVVVFERMVSHHMEAIAPILMAARKKASLLWVASPSFVQNAEGLVQSDERLIWPFDIDTVIDMIETTIGLPDPPEETTQKINEDEINEMILKQKAKVDVEKKYNELLKHHDSMREEFGRLQQELKKEREKSMQIKQWLTKVLEVMSS